MGVVNRTPDSFSDGGRFSSEEAAREQVARLIDAGADVIDLGAESTRPGAPSVSAEEQRSRLGGIVEFAVSKGAVVSVDTTEPEVARFALERGARMVNSVSLEPAAALGSLASKFGAELVLTHCRGPMTEMRGFSNYAADAYGDVVVDVVNEWKQAAEDALASGVPAERLWFDPGLGFAKNAEQSLELCVRLREIRSLLGHPILVGPSRKSFLGIVTRTGGSVAAADARLGGSLAAALDCAARGADMLRVHDVAETVQALAYQRALIKKEQERRESRAGIHKAQRGDSQGGEECSRG